MKRHVYIFLRRDGTVITFHERGMADFFDPVAKRLRKSQSMLRRKPDASLLVHALLDNGMLTVSEDVSYANIV